MTAVCTSEGGAQGSSYSTRAVLSHALHLTCTDKPYKANHQLASAPECLYYCMYSVPSVQHKVLYVRCSYSSKR